MKTTTALASAMVWLLLAARTDASIVDQSSSPADDNAFIVENSQFLAQTFTVGISGLLDQVKVEVARNFVPPVEPLILDIRSVLSDGKPGSLVLASKPILATELSSSFALFGVDLRPFGLEVTENEKLSIVLYTDAISSGGGGINPYAWKLGSYARGQGYVKFPLLDSAWDNFTPDYGFQTFVEPKLSPVPEPSTIGLWAAGALLFLGAKYRSRGNRKVANFVVAEPPPRTTPAC